MDRIGALSISSLCDRVHSPVVGKDVSIVTETTCKNISASAAGDDVVEFVARDVVARGRTTDDVLEHIHRRKRELEVRVYRLLVNLGEVDGFCRSAG